MAAVAGCSSQTKGTGSGQSAEPTLTWWLCGDQPSNLADGVAKLNEYTSKKIGVKIDIKVAGWGDYDTKMNNIINAGDDFDIMFVNNTNYNRFVAQGKFADITSTVKSKTPDLYKLIPEAVWKGTYINGKSYAVPTYKDSAVTQYWVWDDSIVKKYNLDINNIKTMQDLDKAFRTIKAGEGKNYYPLRLNQADGFAGLFNNYDDLAMGLQPIGVRYDDKTRKVVSVLDQQDMMDNFKLLHSWYQDGIINQDASTLKDPPKGRPFFSAQAFPGAEVSYQQSEGVAKYDMVQVWGPTYSTSSIQGSMNAISANSKNKEAALKYLQLVNTDDQLRDMLAFGVEGTNWARTDKDNVIKLLQEKNTWTLAAYQQGTFFDLSAIDPNPGNQYDAVKKLNEEAKSSVTLGYAADISNITAEVANCKTIWEKYKFEMITGASDPQTAVPQAVAELKKNGMDKIISTLQPQIDKYFK